MNLFLNKFLSNTPVINIPMLSRQDKAHSNKLCGPDRDTFMKNRSEVSFTGKGSSGSTKKGNDLKELENITCPYSGLRMITTSKMDKIENDLSKCHNIREQMEIIEPYFSHMQKLEKTLFSVFKGYELNHPEGNLNDCLNILKPECLAQLRISELKVLDEVDKISNKLDPKTALDVRKVTIEARKKIVEDKQDKIFKRKDLLKDLYDVTKDYPNQEIVKEMWQKANTLPKSTKDYDAFIVKYANRTPHEIAARLLRPSTVSIEHIRPANPCSDNISKGEDNMSNFMMAARDWNSGRNNTPLPEFIQKHPNIPKFSQRYINDIIREIHKGRLVDNDWYPYVIKERLYNESEGLINLNLDKYKIDKETAFANIHDDIKTIYDELVEKNEKIRNSVPIEENRV